MNLKSFFDNLSIQGGLHIAIKNEEGKILFSTDDIASKLGEKDTLSRYVKMNSKWYDAKKSYDQETGYHIESYYDISLYIDLLKKVGACIEVKQENQVLFYTNEIVEVLSGKVPADGKAHYVDSLNKWYEYHEIENVSDSNTTYTIGQYIEVTQYVKENEELKFDVLTGLYNRHGIFEKLQELVSQIKTNEFIVIIGDIDYFKLINDTYGHKAGDAVLKEIGNILNKVVTNGFCGRYGGEEFLIVLDTNDMNHAYQSVERIRKMLENTEFLIEGRKIRLTMSFGISIYNKNEYNKDSKMSISEIIKTADIALMTSKQTGRNKTLIYNDIMNPDLLEE